MFRDSGLSQLIFEMVSARRIDKLIVIPDETTVQSFDYCNNIALSLINNIMIEQCISCSVMITVHEKELTRP